MEDAIRKTYEKMNPTEEQKERILTALLKAQESMAQNTANKIARAE